MTTAKSTPKSEKQELKALTGIRFFAVFHIFLFHLWVLYDLDKQPDFSNLMSDFAHLPDVLRTFLAHGYVSTSFFFIVCLLKSFGKSVYLVFTLFISSFYY